MTRAKHPFRRGRLRPAYALVGAVVLLGAGLAASGYQERVFRAQRARELTVQGEILAASVTAALTFGDVRTVQEYVSAFAINREIAAVGVYDSNRNLVGSFARAGSEPLPRSVNRDGATQDRAMTISVPVTQDRDRLGTVTIRAVVEPTARRIARNIPMMLLAGMAALLVSFMGASQRTLRDANAQLESRAVALAESNQRLQIEMEERSNAEDALRQSQKLEVIGQLAGGVAHDFNNLLAVIQGNLHLLRKAGGDRETSLPFIEGAGDAADRAGHLVRRLLAFSRRQPLAPRPIDVNQLATGMTHLILHSVGDRVRVEWNLYAKWATLCDANQMENVLLNLAINARDAMPDGGTLTIGTRDVVRQEAVGGIASGEYVELTMRDTGVGMSEEVRKRAGEPFFTTKPHGQGTGLGLSTASAFIRQSGGQLKIESVSGSGTTVTIHLPRHVVPVLTEAL